MSDLAAADRFMRAVARLILKVFFREVEVVGAERVLRVGDAKKALRRLHHSIEIRRLNEPLEICSRSQKGLRLIYISEFPAGRNPVNSTTILTYAG